METLIVAGIGLAALGYMLRSAWRGINGKSACNCGGSCPNGGCCDKPADRS